MVSAVSITTESLRELQMGTRQKSKTISTALALSLLAFLPTVAAFASLYSIRELFWPSVWLFAVLPGLLCAVVIRGIREAFKQWNRQLLVTAVMLGVNVSLIVIATTPRFAFHQLLTFRPLDVDSPTNTFLFVQQFAICSLGTPCEPSARVSRTQIFNTDQGHLKLHSIGVVNDHVNGTAADSYRVVLNGREVEFNALKNIATARVDLQLQNTISVELTGRPAAKITVWVR
jgi:hypothetical protein